MRGFTKIELLLAATILAVLATVAIPLARWDDKRRSEARLRVTLRMMRDAIDKYHEYSEEGLIVQQDVEQRGYPLTLDELVEGVDVGNPQAPDSQVVRFLQRVPVDPMTGEATWGRRSYQDDWDANSWGGENIYDVYSLSPVVALDGTYYSEW